MNNRVRGALASLVMGAGMVAATVMAQDKATLASEKDKVSYAIGLDVARSFQPIARDIDFAAIVRLLDQAGFDGYWVLEQDIMLDEEPPAVGGPINNAAKSFEALKALA